MKIRFQKNKKQIKKKILNGCCHQVGSPQDSHQDFTVMEDMEIQFTLPLVLQDIVRIETGRKYVINVARLPQTVLASLDVREVCDPAAAAYAKLKGIRAPPEFGLLVQCIHGEPEPISKKKATKRSLPPKKRIGKRVYEEPPEFVVIAARDYDPKEGLFFTYREERRINTLNFPQIGKEPRVKNQK